MATDSFVGDGLTPSPYKLALAELEAERETIVQVHLSNSKDLREIHALKQRIENLENQLLAYEQELLACRVR